jgi:hypothetical protein
MDFKPVDIDLPFTARRNPPYSAMRMLLATALMPALLAGCQQAASPALSSSVAASTPEGRLQLAMRRLDHALQSAQPAANSGVTSTRRSRHQLHEPSDKDSRYTATVLIETTIALAPGAEDKAKIKAIGPEGAAAGVEPNVSTQRFELAYENDRWELVDPPQEELPEDSVERICFQYALSDG